MIKQQTSASPLLTNNSCLRTEGSFFPPSTNWVLSSGSLVSVSIPSEGMSDSTYEETEYSKHHANRSLAQYNSIFYSSYIRFTLLDKEGIDKLREARS